MSLADRSRNSQQQEQRETKLCWSKKIKMTASFILEAKEPSPAAHAEKLREEKSSSGVKKGRGHYAVTCFTSLPEALVLGPILVKGVRAHWGGP